MPPEPPVPQPSAAQPDPAPQLPAAQPKPAPPPNSPPSPSLCDSETSDESLAAAEGAGLACRTSRPPSTDTAAIGGRAPQQRRRHQQQQQQGDGGEEDAYDLEFLETNGYFDMPIQARALPHLRAAAAARRPPRPHAPALPPPHPQQAAADLAVGVTTLKKVCRRHNIGRWPYRKRCSLNRLIDKTKHYFKADPEQCADAVTKLEAQRSVLQARRAARRAGSACALATRGCAGGPASPAPCGSREATIPSGSNTASAR